PRHLPSFPTRRSSDLSLPPYAGRVVDDQPHAAVALEPPHAEISLALAVVHRGAPADLSLESCKSEVAIEVNRIGAADVGVEKRRSEEHTSELQSRRDL